MSVLFNLKLTFRNYVLATPAAMLTVFRDVVEIEAFVSKHVHQHCWVATKVRRFQLPTRWWRSSCFHRQYFVEISGTFCRDLIRRFDKNSLKCLVYMFENKCGLCPKINLVKLYQTLYLVLIKKLLGSIRLASNEVKNYFTTRFIFKTGKLIFLNMIGLD